jgi:preprotein translocase subunit SecD
VPILFEQVEIPLDEATGQNPMATLELCLCHPENDRLEGELKSIGRLTDDVLANAPKIDGYRLMRSKECDDAVYYVSEKAELTHDDIVSAKVMKPFGEDDRYEVSVKLTPEGRGRLARLTRDHQPHGAKNNSDRGRALAIVVNGELLAAPIIQAEINTGEAVIMGNFTKEEAVNLAVALNTRRNEEE